jgi:hypothetical protein
MRQLFTSAMVILTAGLSAQITVNSWHFLGPSEVVLVGNDDQPSITHTDPGPNQTWNYGELNNYGSETFAYGPAQWFPGYQSFPNANYGLEDEGLSIFFRKNNEAFDLLGIYGDLFENGQIQAVPFTPYQRQLAFPITYGQTWQNTSVLKFTFTDLSDLGIPGDSIVTTTTTHRMCKVDAWGTLNTPLGSFSVLRLHLKDSTIQNIRIYTFGVPFFDQSDTEITHNYSFLSNSPNTKYFLLQYNYDPSTQELTGVQWQMAEPTASNESHNNVFKEPEIYPNPCKDSFAIKNLQTGDKVSILNTSGQTVSTYTVSNKNMTFNTNEFASGNYLVIIYSKSGIFAKKLVVE